MDLLLHPFKNLPEFLTGFLLVLSSIGVISLTNPVHASLSFLMTLLLLAMLYMELAAEFIGIAQVLVYAGAILVIFIFVIILFQDAHLEISKYKAKANKYFIFTAAFSFLLAGSYFLYKVVPVTLKSTELNKNFGTAESLGKTLYIDFFFPFEAVVFLFLVAIVGAFYIGKKPLREEPHK